MRGSTGEHAALRIQNEARRKQVVEEVEKKKAAVAADSSVDSKGQSFCKNGGYIAKRGWESSKGRGRGIASKCIESSDRSLGRSCFCWCAVETGAIVTRVCRLVL